MAEKPLEKMTKTELIRYAQRKRLRITYIRQRSKPDILERIREAQRA